VVDIHQSSRSFHAGLVVDCVQEVMNIVKDHIDDAPQFGAGVNTDFLLGIGKAGSAIKLLLDIDCVLEGMGTLMSN
jgi:purine-binding chemotaxis protein CheW